MMNELKNRITANIRSEVRNFLRKEIPLPERDERWKDITAKLLVEERELLEKEREAKCMADYENMNTSLKKAYQSSGNDTPYEEWLEKVKKLYKTEGVTVTSLASGPDHMKTWKLNSAWQAKKKVLQLIYWMYYNHFLRDGAQTKELRYDPDGEE